MKWDFDTGVQIPVKKVDYGEELYEQAVQIWAKQFALEKGRNGSKINVGAILSSMKDDTKKEEKCRDFSKPAFHSSLKVTNELTKALDHLNQLPDQMERIFLHDDRFEPIVLDRVSIYQFLFNSSNSFHIKLIDYWLIIIFFMICRQQKF